MIGGAIQFCEKWEATSSLGTQKGNLYCSEVSHHYGIRKKVIRYGTALGGIMAPPFCLTNRLPMDQQVMTYTILKKQL